MDEKNLVGKLAARLPGDNQAAAGYLLNLLRQPEVALELTPDQLEAAKPLIAQLLTAYALKIYHEATAGQDPTRDLAEVTPGDGWHKPEHHRHPHAPHWKSYGERPVFINAPFPDGQVTDWSRRCCGVAMRRLERIVRHTCSTCRISEWRAMGLYAACDRCGKRKRLS